MPMTNPLAAEPPALRVTDASQDEAYQQAVQWHGRDLARLVGGAFPGARITFEPDPRRQGIVDSWPADVDVTAAVKDWGWNPHYSLEKAFGEYLIPAVLKRYGSGSPS